MNNFTIEKEGTIAEALAVIEANHWGFVVVVDSSHRAIGLLTDGDIRRTFLDGASANDVVGCLDALNKKFTSGLVGESRESLLKKLDLDGGIKVIPVVDHNGILVDIFMPERMLAVEHPRVVRARSPARISFGGGGTDSTKFFHSHGGTVLVTSIALYCHATIIPVEEEIIKVTSYDLNDEVVISSLDELNHEKINPRFVLFWSIFKLIKPQLGVHLIVRSDFEIGSGLGGSSAVVAAVLGCFNKLRLNPWSKHEIAEFAFQIERLIQGVDGGWQDQYATVFGGVNFIEFSSGKNLVNPLRIPPEVFAELEESLVLCFSGVSRPPNFSEKECNSASKPEVLVQLKKIQESAVAVRSRFLAGDITGLAKILCESWVAKANMAGVVPSSLVDIYNFAMDNGAFGGKLLGAGGGGYMVFLVEPTLKDTFRRKMEAKNVFTTDIFFDQDGLFCWLVDKSHNEVVF